MRRDKTVLFSGQRPDQAVSYTTQNKWVTESLERQGIVSTTRKTHIMRASVANQAQANGYVMLSLIHGILV